jgi:putative addiction module killer protein
MKQVKIFQLNENKVPLQEWLDSLRDNTTKARILERIKRLSVGHFGDCKRLDAHLSELRFQFGSGYRIYYSEINKVLILLLCGGDKATQSQDIQTARNYLKIYRENAADE